MRRYVKIEQQSFYDCGAACLCSIASWYGVKISATKARAICGCTKDGITIKGILEGGRSLGFICNAFKTTPELNITSLQNLTLPAIAHLRTEDGILHFIVIYKIDKSHFTIMNPDKGRIQKMSHDKFIKLWTGYIILFEPGSNLKIADEKRGAILRLLHIAYCHKRELSRIILGSVTILCSGLCSSIFLQRIIDDAIIKTDLNRLATLSIAIIALAGLTLFINYSTGLYSSSLCMKIDRRLIINYIKRILSLPLIFHKRYQPGDINARIGDAFNIRLFLTDGIVSIIVSVASIIISIPIVLYYSKEIAILLFSFTPLYIILYILSGYINKKYNKGIAVMGAKFESDFLHHLDTIDAIKHNGKQVITEKMIKDSFSTLSEKIYKTSVANVVFGISAQSLSKGMATATLIVGAYSAFYGNITVGELASFYSICALFSAPLTNLASLNPIITQAVVSAERIFEILDCEIEEDTTKSISEENIATEEKIIISNLSFAFTGRLPLFKNLNAEFAKGKISLVNGEIGCGKSTLASLIMRDYEVNDGDILYGNKKISSFPLELWRESISIVPQKCKLFNSTILENITCGKQAADIEIITKISNSIGLTKEIQKMPLGYLTNIGDTGVTLSGGQMQKIAIARALFKDSETMIFDESTSFMDKESVDLFITEIIRLKKLGKRIIIISHDFIFKDIADNIVVIK